MPFVSSDDSTAGERCLASERATMDKQLQRAINNANQSAGVMISLGKTLAQTQDQARAMMDKVAKAIEGEHRRTQAVQRVYVSYAWLLHATNLVRQLYLSPKMFMCLLNLYSC